VSQNSSTRPTPKFYFKVTFGSGPEAVSFQEVAGLDTETQPIEFSGGNSAQFSTVRMPGIARPGNVTLKKGVFVKDTSFFKLFDSINLNTVKHETVVI
jgi:phage tail-like protein